MDPRTYDSIQISTLKTYIKAHPPWAIEKSTDGDTYADTYSAKCVISGKEIALGFVVTREGKAAPDRIEALDKLLNALSESMAQACALTWLGLDAPLTAMASVPSHHDNNS